MTRTARHVCKDLLNVRDFLADDLIDTLHVVQVPILLGRGVRLWDGVEGVEGVEGATTSRRWRHRAVSLT